LAPGGWSDEIHLTSGRVLQGVVEEESPRGVAITVAGGNRVRVAHSDIVEIRREGPEVNALLLGDLHFEQGQLLRAAAAYQEAIDLGLPEARVAEALLRHPTALITLLEEVPEEDAAELRSLFLSILGAAPRTDKVLHLAGRISESTGDLARAADAYAQISPAWWDANPNERQAVGEFHRAAARRALDASDFEGVLKSFEQLVVVDPGLAAQLGPVFHIQLANLQFDQGNWTDAIEMVTQMVAPEAPEIARLYLESKFAALEHRRLSADQMGEVIAIFENHLRANEPEHAEERLAEMYLRYGHQLLGEERWDESRAAFEKHYDMTDPRDTVRPLVKSVTLVERASQLAEGDVDGIVKVTVDMIENEMWDEALQMVELLQSVDNPEVRTFATRQRQAIWDRRAVALLDEALELYDAEDYMAALDLINDSGEILQSGRLAEEIRELRQLSVERMNTVPGHRAAQALLVFQQAERHFYAAEFEDAINLLISLLEEYGDTPVADQARQMLRTCYLHRSATRPGVDGFEITEVQLSSPELLRREFEELLDSVDEEETIP
jgi:tetratricopeptide (TPR) repeat protein